MYYLDHELILIFLVKAPLLLFIQRGKIPYFIKLADRRNKLILVGEEEKKNKALLSRKLNALRFLVCVLVIDGYMEHVPNCFAMIGTNG